MAPRPATVTALLPHARDLLRQHEPDTCAILKLFDHLPLEDLDVQTRVAIGHARLLTSTGDLSNQHRSVARFALARVIALLEKHMASELRRPL